MRIGGTVTCIALALLACGPRAADRIPLELTRSATVARDSAETMEELVFTEPFGDSAIAYLRRPARTPEGGLGGVVLVAGRETGRQAARVVPGPLEVAVLAVEYPDALPEDLRVGALLAELPEVRDAALRVPGLLSGAAHWLAERPDVDADRIVLVGVSFGVPFAAAAGTDPIFRGVALHHGGGDLGLLLDANLPIEGRLPRWAATTFLGWYFRALDPAAHVDDYGSTPLLLINGTRDTQVPRAAVERLAEEASGPVRAIWLDHEHLMPGDTLLMRELADSTLAHFRFLEAPRGVH